MKPFALSLSLVLCGCGFKFALGTNPFGAPLAPVVVKDFGGEGVGDALRRHIPAALARAGLSKGAGPARRLSIELLPWKRASLYNTVDGRTVVFGEQFVITAVARVAGSSRVVRRSEVVVLAPRNDLENRALDLRRVAEKVAFNLAYALAEALE
jgi:hypothetical protein